MTSRKNSDIFDNFIKSIKPLDYKFSYQSQKYDIYFKKLNLESLNKTLQRKIKPALKYKDSLLHKKVDYTYNLKNDSYEYIENIEGEKKIPIKMEKNKKIKETYYSKKKNLLKKFEELLFNNKKEEEKNFKPKKIIKYIKEINHPLFGVNRGNYEPNYNYIKKRIPCIIFNKSNNSHFSYDKNNIKRNNTEENKKEDNNDIKKEKLNLDNNSIKNAKMTNQLIKFNLSQHITKNSFKIISRNPKNKNNNYFPHIKSSQEKTPDKK